MNYHKEYIKYKLNYICLFNLKRVVFSCVV
jgi:hypothetical protein